MHSKHMLMCNNSQCQQFPSSLLSKCSDSRISTDNYVHTEDSEWRPLEVCSAWTTCLLMEALAGCSLLLENQVHPLYWDIFYNFSKGLLLHGGDKEGWFKLFMLLDWRFRDPFSNSGLTCGSQIIAGRQPRDPRAWFLGMLPMCARTILNSILDFAPCGQSF